ncbi:MAG: universal stress protein [Proteobacteria bacterium]|nr:universal stress protein [Pseudomonadota bacterium]MBU1738453.1 universal stress protein [Pseudomonadota bacterium]
MSEDNFTDLARRDRERHLLLAVDESDNSRRAVMYVADFFGDYRDVFVTLLSIIPEPSEDYFPNDAERVSWLQEKKLTVEKALADYHKILQDAGFPENRIDTRLSVRQCVSIGDAILEEQARLRCCIVVAGRRGLTHNEEFIFGSTSSKLLHHASHCAVMIIE